METIINETQAVIQATNYNLSLLQKNLQQIRTSLPGKYSQKQFVEAVNNINNENNKEAKILTVPGLSKIEGGSYDISIKIAKAIFVLLANIVQRNPINIRLVNLLKIFVYTEQNKVFTFDETKQRQYAKKILSSPVIDKEIIFQQNHTKNADKVLLSIDHIAELNINIEDVLLVDIRSAISKNLKNIRLICGASINEFVELLGVKFETYKHWDGNKTKLDNKQCIDLLKLINKKYPENKQLPTIISLITNRYYSNFEKEIDTSIKNYANSYNLSEDIKENLYANSIVYLSRYISFHQGKNEGIDLTKAVREKWLKPYYSNIGNDIFYLHSSEPDNTENETILQDDFEYLKKEIMRLSNKLSDNEKESLIELLKAK